MDIVWYVAGMRWFLDGACWIDDEIEWSVDGARRFVGSDLWKECTGQLIERTGMELECFGLSLERVDL